MICVHEQHEFLHIRTMVLELERLVRNGSDLSLKTPGPYAGYWRKRVHAVLAARALSPATVDQASALFQKLNCIAGEQQKCR